MRLRVREFSNHYARAVEEPSNRIMEMSTVPSTLQLAFIDTWTFTAQIVNYFETGGGKEAFGKFQPIVVDTSWSLETQIMNNLKAWVTPERFEKAKNFVKDWKYEHPIETHFFNRDSTLPHLTDLFREDRK